MMSNFTFGGPPYSRFSAGYILVNGAELVTWSDELAGMCPDLYNTLAVAVGEPIVGLVEGQHYEFRPMHGIPSNTAAVPAENHGNAPSALLLKHYE